MQSKSKSRAPLTACHSEVSWTSKTTFKDRHTEFKCLPHSCLEVDHHHLFFGYAKIHSNQLNEHQY